MYPALAAFFFFSLKPYRAEARTRGLLQKRVEGAPSVAAVPRTPSRDDILELLRACGKQTSAFN
jgi:hypothetical protein